MMVPSLEVSIAEISRDIKYIIKRIDENDAEIREFRQRVTILEKQFYAATIIGSLLWAVVLLWIRQQLGA
ncbi:hypothetical protein UFOVP698_18 [uncultured Caudovirales phage]|uniref:Uncharacterized protein n=1 Tax=uncultured Caudovirales phage TaxID=2100421 RepID=A0A6J5NH10_9CAUD|nr:hypothetical protein UFOVP698_18 [uncultured Caudovirales phage]